MALFTSAEYTARDNKWTAVQHERPIEEILYVDNKLPQIAMRSINREQKFEDTVGRHLDEAVTVPDWLAPQTSLLQNRFTIKRILGSGGMGAIYEVFDSKKETSVAIKTLLSLDASAIYRLKNEFRSLADVVHPNLVCLHELYFDADRNLWFFTMDLVPGTALSALIGLRLGDGWIRNVFSQIWVGVQAIHEAGKLHRDLKPSNVVVTPEERAVVLDFGLVADQEPGGVGQTAVDDCTSGTPLYMAPEQSAGDPASTASDWYAFGVMLFEALTGRSPFGGAGRTVLSHKLHDDAPMLSKFRNGVPEDLEQLCARLLNRRPERRPSNEEIQAVLGVVKRSSASAITPRRTAFVGRSREIAILREAFNATARGAPAVAFVQGPSGMGKTVLAERFLSDLELHGMAVTLSAHCYERESVPYKACDGLIDSLSRYIKKQPAHRAAAFMPRNIHTLTRIFPVLARLEAVKTVKRRLPLPVDPAELRRSGFGALKELLARIATQEPLVLYIDDLQWSDMDSAELLASLLAPPDAPSLFLIGVFRSDEISRSPGLARLLDHLEKQKNTHVTQIDLGPLNRNEAQTLSRALLPGFNQSQADNIVTDAGGSPFFITELARYATTRQAKQVDVKNAIRHRISTLSDAERELLESICVSARPIGQGLIQRVTNRDAVTVRMRQLESMSLIRYQGGTTGKVFSYHDRIREAVVSSLTSTRLKWWHNCFALAIEADANPDLAALTRHYLGAEENARAGACAIQAGEQAMKTLAFDQAAEMFRVALSHAEIDQSERVSLQTALAEALINARRCAEAGRELLGAAELTDPSTRGELRRRGAEQLLFGGHIDEGMVVLEEAFSDHGLNYETICKTDSQELRQRLEQRGLSFKLRRRDQIADDELRRLDMLWAAAHGTQYIKDSDSIALGYTFALEALDMGEPLHVARALAMISIFNSWFLHKDNPALRALQRLDEQRPEPHISAWLALAQGNDAFWAHRVNESIEYFERAESVFLSQCRGVAREVSSTRLLTSLAIGLLMDINTLKSRCVRWQQEARELEHSHLTSHLSFLAFCAVAEDRPEKAKSDLEKIIAESSRDMSKMTFLHMNSYLALVETYMGEARGFEQIDNVVKSLAKTVYDRIPMTRYNHRRYRAIVAIALATKHPDPERLLCRAEQDAQELSNTRAADGRPVEIPYWQSQGVLIQACLAAARLDRVSSLRLIDEALQIMSATKDKNYVVEAGARLRKGQLIGGKEGAALVARAEDELKQIGVKNTARYCDYVVPGFAGILLH